MRIDSGFTTAAARRASAMGRSSGPGSISVVEAPGIVVMSADSTLGLSVAATVNGIQNGEIFA